MLLIMLFCPYAEARFAMPCREHADTPAAISALHAAAATPCRFIILILRMLFRRYYAHAMSDAAATIFADADILSLCLSRRYARYATRGAAEYAKMSFSAQE